MKLYSSINSFACNLACCNGFRSDRAAGLNYGLFKYSNGKFAKSREEASRNCFFCVYCGQNSKLEIEVNKNFVEVSPEIFRSWAGKRKIDGMVYNGAVYYYLSDSVSKTLPRNG